MAENDLKNKKIQEELNEKITELQTKNQYLKEKKKMFEEIK
jgi:hypothetical protein